MRGAGGRSGRSVVRSGWRVGADLGGTWVRVVAVRGRGRPLAFVGPAPAPGDLPALLRRLWRRWVLAAGQVRMLVVASKGVWTAAERRRLARRLGTLARRVRVMPDVEAAYRGALGDAAGILLLAGTGSMALGRGRRRAWARAGGLGPLLGDEGSAFWIGREWLRTDTTGQGFRAVRRMLGTPDPVARIAALAPVVLRRARAGSPRARRVVGAAQEALARLLDRTARRLALPRPVPVSWAGGLLADARFRAGVWRAARRRGLQVAPRPPRETPLGGVLEVAGVAQPELRRAVAAPRHAR